MVEAISTFSDVHVEGLEMWVDFGVGKHREVSPIHHMITAIGVEKAAGIRFFHSFNRVSEVYIDR